MNNLVQSKEQYRKKVLLNGFHFTGDTTEALLSDSNADAWIKRTSESLYTQTLGKTHCRDY